jgi:hypothetical protein
MMKPRGALTSLCVSATLLLPAGAGDALAFVPACTEEVAAHYPPILRSDLSACSVPSEPKPELAMAMKPFVQSFGGTWVLQARTVQGIVVKANSQVHVDLDRVGANGGQGAFLTLECADARCTSPTVVAGSMLDLGMTGDRVVVAAQPPVVNQGLMKAAAGTPKPATQTPARFRFFQQAGVYVAIDERDRGQAAERKWDRVVLTERTLTYISCKDGRVDRYVKSSPRSQVGSTPVEQFLKQAVVGM